MTKSLKMIIVVTIIVIIAIIVMGISNKPKSKEKGEKINIVVTTFSSYDFTKQIVGDKADVYFLLSPGVDSHSYDPSTSDIIKIKNADIFIYVGGEMEKWAERFIDTDVIDKNKTVLIKVTDSVEKIEEKDVDGAEEDTNNEQNNNHIEGAFDEHIWTSPKNAIKMVEYLKNQIIEFDEPNKEIYNKNANEYIAKIKDVQSKIQEIVDNKKRNRLVFGDKMPIQYFLEEFGLTASAAFNGCSTEIEPSAKTVIYLINKVKEESIPIILYIELSTGKTAKTIAKETGAKAMQIQTLHNVTKEDFERGETYVSLMTRNLDVLKQALQ